LTIHPPIRLPVCVATTTTPTLTGDGGAEALASLMEHAPLLEDLRFSGTRAGPKGSMVRAEVRKCGRA